MTDYRIKTVEEYRELRGDSHQMIYDKSMTVIDEHIRDFLALSTFLTVASIDAEGRMDVSPKGDPPGFVKVVDERTIAIPEREGNRRADTFTNVRQILSVGLIFFVPGMDETMRINGTATLTTDPELLATMEHKGHIPVLAMLVHVEEAFIHCGKAPKRGRLVGCRRSDRPTDLPEDRRGHVRPRRVREIRHHPRAHHRDRPGGLRRQRVPNLSSAGV